MILLENDMLTVAINPKGAELTSLFHKVHRIEYMWGGDPAFWGKHSPVLFPIVGSLKQNTYYYKGLSYTLPRHGFARDLQFSVEDKQGEMAVFVLESSPDTLEVFPFLFKFSIHYKLSGSSLCVTYAVENRSTGEMFFSVGAHPAFAVPIVPGTAYHDYKLIFNLNETAGRWPISREGLIMENSILLLRNQSELPLSKELFSMDAIVLKQLASSTVILGSDRTEHGLRFSFNGFPYLGLWAAKDADFVCIEPWCGIADSVTASQELTEKEGINKLQGGELFSRSWQVDLW